MKQQYFNGGLYATMCILLLLGSSPLVAQCVCSDGRAPLTVSYSLVGNISPSVDSSIFKFPQFDPNTGLLICVNAKAYVTSVVRMRLENDETFDVSNYRIRYNRNDNLTGPGINPPVWGILDKNYGPYPLTATDGIYFSGSDFISIGPDTVYKDKIFEATTSNVVSYLGNDSIFFTYKVTGVTDVTGSSNYIFSIRANDRIEFFMTYSYCRTGILPLGIREFNASKTDHSTVVLDWTAENESQSNFYEIEFSKNGLWFEKIGSQAASVASGTAAKYQYQHHPDKTIAGKVYYRIKQSDQSGKLIYSPVRAIQLDESSVTPLSLFPNPVSHKVTMKFDFLADGMYLVQLISMTGQQVLTKQVKTNGVNSITLDIPAQTVPGMYHLHVKEINSNKTFSGKLLIQR